MKARYTTFNSSLTFEIEGEGPKAIIKELAAIQEIFEAERACGVCGSDAIRFQFRQVDDFDFYELLCTAQGCRARFAFGQAKKGGGLFPKRKDEEGKWIANGGWVKYVKPGNGSESDDNYTPAPLAPPEGEMQETYRRLAARFNCHPPVSFQAALAMMYDKMRAAKASDEYQGVYKAFCAAYPQGTKDPSIMRKVLSDLWTAMQDVISARQSQVTDDDVPF